MSRYRIPASIFRFETKISNSRFIATLTPVSEVRATYAFLKSIREEMPDASHHVYAFRVGYGASVSEGMSDDGEPSGTSGPPTMAVLRGADIGDAMIVTTRYFGGTKLGTGGLVTAYTLAAKGVIDIAHMVDKVILVSAALDIPYTLLERVRRVVIELQGLVNKEVFGELVTLEVALPEEQFTAFRARITDLTSGTVQVRTL